MMFLDNFFWFNNFFFTRNDYFENCIKIKLIYSYITPLTNECDDYNF